MTTLYLCEKPSQAKDIAAVLGRFQRKDGYLVDGDTWVSWCVGHLLEMANPDDYDPKYKRWSFDTLPILPDPWVMKVSPRTRKQFQVVQRLLRKTDHLVIATDADREGETIAREILELCDYRGPVSRLWLSALDARSVRKALDNLKAGDETRALYDAGLGRGRADWLIGMNLTRAYTLLAKQAGSDQVVSVGRVQTPALNLVVERDRVIENFKPVPYFDLLADFEAHALFYRGKWLPDRSPSVPVDMEGRCLHRDAAEAVRSAVDQQQGRIVRFEKNGKAEKAPLPFDLSSLQIEASKRFGLDANAVLKAAQALYETHKATTYPRTDCRYLPLSQFEEAGAVLDAIRQSDPAWPHVDNADPSICSRCWNDKKITAHHAIIPTSAAFDLSALNRAERQVYELIRRNFVMQFYGDYRYQAIECETEVAGHRFLSRGRQLIEAGWRVLMGESKAQDEEDMQDLPVALEEGLSSRVLQVSLECKETRPPARYTSGTLIAAMKNAGKTVEDPELRRVLRETAGIGTEATRAGIIDTLLDRGYIRKEKKHLVSTDFGRRLIDTVPAVLKDPATTALWEQVLDDIAQGHSPLDRFIENQKTFVRQMIEYLSQQQTQQARDPRAQASSGGETHPCPSCGKPMRQIRLNKPKKSVFWGCSDYPECRTTLPDHRGRPGAAQKKNATRKQLVIGKKCPQCSTGNLVQKTLKNGVNAGKPFIGCSNFPKCKVFAWVNPANPS